MGSYYGYDGGDFVEYWDNNGLYYADNYDDAYVDDDDCCDVDGNVSGDDYK